MKALSIDPEYTWYIFNNEKTIECRTWKTNYRGPLLICASKIPVPGCISGHAYCTAELVDVVDFDESHVEAAMMEGVPEGKAYAWILDDVRPIYPIPVRGTIGLFDVDDSLIKYLDEEFSDDVTEAELEKAGREFFEKYINPLVYLPAQL